MARKPVEIAVAADTREYQKDIDKGVIRPLEDVQDAMKDVAKVSDKTSDDLVDGMRDAQKATEKFQDALRDGAAAKKFAHNTEDATDKASEHIGTFKDEAKANFSEVASSFSGDMDSAIDLVQGTLGGLAADIPGVGIALGALGAAAGLFYNQWKEKTAAAKQRVDDMYQDMLESGNTFLTAQFVQNALGDIWGEADGAAVSLRELKILSDDTGISQAEWAAAYAGDADTRKRVTDKLARAEKELQKQYKTATDENIVALDATQTKLGGAWDALHRMGVETDSAKTKVQNYRNSVSLLKNDYEKLEDAQHAAFGTVIDDLGTIKDAAAGVPKEVTVKAKLDSTTFENDLKKLTKKQWAVGVTPEFRTKDGRVIK